MVSLVLMGAGASHGSGPVTPYQPPFGNGSGELFDRLDAEGGEASRLSGDLKKMFRCNFEIGMATYARLPDSNVMKFHRELAAYLLKFEPGPGNAYVTLISQLGIEDTIYASLNYDILFELAAASIGYGGIRYGVEKGGAPRLLKIHGSCNFWPDLPNGTLSECYFGPNVKVDIACPVRPLNREESLRQCRIQNSLSPAIAMYAEGKPIRVCPAYVGAMLAEWKESVMVATQIFVSGVGINPVDDHIWGPLGDANASVTYFGFPGDKKGFDDWKENKRKKDATFVEADFVAAIPKMRERLNISYSIRLIGACLVAVASASFSSTSVAGGSESAYVNRFDRCNAMAKLYFEASAARLYDHSRGDIKVLIAGRIRGESADFIAYKDDPKKVDRLAEQVINYGEFNSEVHHPRR